jgi:hypothetical protein
MVFLNNGLPNRFDSQQLYYYSFANYDKIGFRRDTGEANDDAICLLGPSTNNIKYFNKDKCIDFDKNKYNVLLIIDY